MKRLIAISFAIAAGASAASIALKPICPECGSYDNVVVGEEVSSILGLNVYLCATHGIYFIRDPRYLSHVWFSKDEIPAVKADYAQLEAENTKAREEKIARMKKKGWSDDIINRVLAKQIRIGDSPEIVREAWGPPDSTYQEDTASSNAETWVYPYFLLSSWVRFENGKVREYQNYTVHRK